MMYSDKVMEHFSDPRNVGVLKDADGVGEVGNPVCGDMMTFYIKVKDDRLSDVKFQTFGCGAAIAVSSMVSEMAMGKTLDEAMQITNQDVADELGGLPGNKMHCSNLGADALHKAIEDYRGHQEKGEPKAAPAPKAKKDDSCCPYCEGPVEGLEAVCGTCHIELGSCDECGEPMNKKGDKCPHCGATTVRV
ncbi:MAG: Fe-S cluster assembly scaffold protein NifU [Candidatus Aminicenantaceae bacterium]